jgi:1-acyl-sn-glycerol-3-phosphate acyltransferase
MRQQLDRLYRRGATGFAFACLFLGGCILAATVLPSIALLPGHRRERAQIVIRATFRFYLAMLQRLSLLHIDIDGRERLDHCRGRLVVANPPSLLDIVMLMALIPDAQCIIKHQLWSSRFLGGVMRHAGYIRNDLEPGALIEACRASLARGGNIIVFPEGTRSAPGGAPRFHRGFANIATLTGAQVQPIVITCTPPTLRKGDPWWAIPETRPVFQVLIKECLDADSYLGYRYRSVASRKLVERMEAYYAEQLAHV